MEVQYPGSDEWNTKLVFYWRQFIWCKMCENYEMLLCLLTDKSFHFTKTLTQNLTLRKIHHIFLNFHLTCIKHQWHVEYMCPGLSPNSIIWWVYSKASISQVPLKHVWQNESSHVVFVYCINHCRLLPICQGRKARLLFEVWCRVHGV